MKNSDFGRDRIELLQYIFGLVFTVHILSNSLHCHRAQCFFPALPCQVHTVTVCSSWYMVNNLMKVKERPQSFMHIAQWIMLHFVDKKFIVADPKKWCYLLSPPCHSTRWCSRFMVSFLWKWRIDHRLSMCIPAWCGLHFAIKSCHHCQPIKKMILPSFSPV